MNRSLPCAVVLVAGFVAGCGGATNAPSTTHTGSTTNAASTTRASSHRSTDRKVTSTSPKASVPAAPVNPCAVLTRSEVSIAFGVAAPAGRRHDAGCTYDAGKLSLVVTAAVATASERTAVQQPLPHRTHLSGPGYVGVAIDLPGTQTEVSLAKGRTYLTLLLTNAKVGGKPVHRADIALAGEAARRL